MLIHLNWLGLRFDGIGATYNLTEQNYSANGSYVAKNSNELAGYLRFKLSKSIFINNKIGYTLGRDYKVFDSKDKLDFALSSIYFGDDRTQLNESFNSGAFFKIELLYRFAF